MQEKPAPNTSEKKARQPGGFKSVWWSFLALTLLVVACLSVSDEELPFSELEFLSENNAPILQNEFDRFGKILKARELEDVYVPASLDTLGLPSITPVLEKALEEQLRLLKRYKQKPRQQIGQLAFDVVQLEETIELILAFKDYPAELVQRLEAHQIWGQDRLGHVRFTGYFTPVLRVRKTPDNVYKYPLYSRPKAWQGALPTRAEIDGQGVLKEQNLELAYAADPVDIYYMQVQGSGFVEFLDEGNNKILLSYDGNNKQPYQSIENYLMTRKDLGLQDLSMRGIQNFLEDKPLLRDTVLQQNPSYVFFHPEGRSVIGAGHVTLTPEVSVAVDNRYFPLGSVILAMAPIWDAKGFVVRHEFRILLPQDVGGAVKGAGHMDVYEGIGQEALQRASNRSHYGMTWLLLPRRAEAAVQ